MIQVTNSAQSLRNPKSVELKPRELDSPQNYLIAVPSQQQYPDRHWRHYVFWRPERVMKVVIRNGNY
jgi:hypothetical protein